MGEWVKIVRVSGGISYSVVVLDCMHCTATLGWMLGWVTVIRWWLVPVPVGYGGARYATVRYTKTEVAAWVSVASHHF